MSIQKIELEPIGLIHSPFAELQNMPIQPKGAADAIGRVEVFEKYAEGLKNLSRFSHVYLLFYFYRARETAAA